MQIFRVLTALFLFLSLWSSCSQEVKPRIERESLVFDFGTARQDARINHTFTIANNGPEPVKVKRVQTTCGCTAATLKEGTEIAPGATVDVPVELNLQGKTGGDIESKVIVVYAGDAKPVELVMKGKLASEYRDSVNLEKFKRGEQPEEIISLATFEGQPPLEIKGIEFKAGILEVTSAPGEDTGTFDLRIKPNAAAEFGPFAEKVVVHTNDTEVPDKTILVRGHVLKKLEGARNRLVIYPEDGKPATGIAEFTSMYGEPIENVAATITKPKRFSAVVEPGASAGTVHVRVTAVETENAKRDHVRGMLSVTATIGGTQVESK
ncbi:MAG: DUF1573 domain-containing protein, partial [Candidatus Hydrogenedentes bacterium]|nr:DUF1573 domain-containing protein [Candidatus Hydrogenedentota bacterium]